MSVLYGSGERKRVAPFKLEAAGSHISNVPSSANSVITVGAYDAKTNTPADFSGRGAASMPNLLTKPDLVAPGVSVIVPSFPGGYQTVSGTSFAAPFVTGSAALLMEWGIVKRNNLFLYGEQLKAWLIAGAKELPGYPVLHIQFCFSNDMH